MHFTSSDGQAVLPANATLTSGAHTFSATLKTVGNQTITATDTATSSITGASNTVVVAAAIVAGPLAFTSGQFPSATVGSAVPVSVTVTNLGTGPANPSAIAAAGSGVTVTGGTCHTGTPVSAAGGTCTVALSWVPTAPGVLASGSLTIAYSGGANPSDALALSGTATQPSSSLPPPLDVRCPTGSCAGANLRGVDLSGLDLSRINFKGANLVGANLSHCVVIGADFTKAIMIRTNLNHTDLSKSIRALMMSTRGDGIPVPFRGTAATFKGADLDYATIRHSHAVGVNFTKASMRNIKATRSDFRLANFTRANLHRANFTGSQHGGAEFTGATGLGATKGL